MKVLLLSFFVLALAKAEPANGDSDVEIIQVEVIEVPWQEGPPQEYGPPPQQENGPPPQQEYGPPPRQEYGPPKQDYGPPNPVYGPPKPVYGPPPELTTTESETTTTEYPTTTEVSGNSTSNSTNSTNSTAARFGRLEKDESVEKGVYYIYHPNGALQRVAYATKDDVQNMEYSAQLKYRNVEPVKGPIYTYDPQTYLFSRVNRK